MAKSGLVDVYLKVNSKEKQKTLDFFSKMTLDFNTRFNQRTIEYAIKAYKEEVVNLTPDKEEEDRWRYGDAQIDYNTRMVRIAEDGQVPLKQAISESQPTIETKKNIVRANWGNKKDINRRTNFWWVHKIRDKKRPGAMLGYEWRTMDENKINTLEFFEYGGTWVIKPRDKGGRLHPYAGEQITYTNSWKEKGLKTFTKMIKPRRMFKEAIPRALKKIEESIRTNLKTYLSNDEIVFPIIDEENVVSVSGSRGKKIISINKIPSITRKQASAMSRVRRKEKKEIRLIEKKMRKTDRLERKKLFAIKAKTKKTKIKKNSIIKWNIPKGYYNIGRKK